LRGRPGALFHAACALGSSTAAAVVLACWSFAYLLLGSERHASGAGEKMQFLAMAFIVYALLAGVPSLVASALAALLARPADRRAAFAIHVSAAATAVVVYFGLGLLASHRPLLFSGAQGAGDALLLACAAAFTAIGARETAERWPLPPARTAGLAALLLAVAGAAPAAAALLAPAPARAAPAAASVDRTNVVLIVADTLRADHLGAYGYASARTPRLDALAEAGTRFDPAYAAASWTGPATATILTGLYPSTHGFKTYQNRIGADAVSVASIFRVAGYRTAGFAANPIVTTKFGFGDGFDLWNADLEPDLLSRHQRTPLAVTLRALHLWDRAKIFPRAEVLVDHALRWLDGAGAAPFFLYLHFMDPHDPYAPPPEFDPARGAGPAPGFAMEFGTLQAIAQGREHAGPGHLERMLQLYDGAIGYMDSEIGRFLDELDRRGLAGRTIVAFTSDHGEEFGDHGALGHEHSLHEELVRIPFFLKGPGVPAGRVLAGPARQIDIGPTILEAAGLPAPAKADGASLWSDVTAGDGAAPGDEIARRDVFMEETFIGVRGPWHSFRALRRGDLKLSGRSFYQSLDAPWDWTLHDLASDPGERFDLAGQRPGEAGRLRESLDDWARRPLPDPGEDAPVDDETLQKLKALGYVQ